MIELERVNIRFPGFHVQNINLSIRSGEFFMLLGPTGAGKTVILEAIAGLIPMTEGRIIVNQRDVTNLPPEQRGIGIVYQDYALFPHLSVWKNILYGLRYHHRDEHESSAWIEWLVEELGIQAILHRTPTNLSGGEKQRVALARALAVHPSVLLLDEPLSALDQNFREGIRDLLKKLHQDLQITFLMVTHDFVEALFLGERMAILHHGQLEQVGTVAEVFYQPKNPFVAEFVGMKNVFPAKFYGQKAVLQTLELQLPKLPPPNSQYIGIRSEDIVLNPENLRAHDGNLLEGSIVEISHRGVYYQVSVQVGESVFTTFLPGSTVFAMQLAPARPVRLSIKPTAIHVF